MDWSQQVPSYTAWVNSQLKKRPGQPLVRDLADPSILNGTGLAALIETVAGVKLDDIIWYPIDDCDKEQNIYVVLDFMRARRVRMHKIEPRGVMSGDVKSVMRLILALAAHYKPASVRHQRQAAQQQLIGESGATLARARKKLAVSAGGSSGNGGDDLDGGPTSGWLSSGCNSPRHGATPSISGSHASSPTGGLLLASATSTGANSHAGSDQQLDEARSELREMRCLILRLQDALSSGPASPVSSIESSSNCCPACSSSSWPKAGELQLQQQQQTIDELSLKVEELQYTLRYSEQRREMAEREAAAARNDNERLRRLVAEHQQCVAALSSELDAVRARQQQHQQHQNDPELDASASSEVAAVVAQCLTRLRLALPAGDSAHVALDTLEHALKITAAGKQPQQQQQQLQQQQQRKIQHIKRLPLSAVPGFPIHRLDQAEPGAGVSTRCLYYTERSAAPYLLNIPRPLGQVTLADVKRCVQLPPATSQQQQQLQPSHSGNGTHGWRYLFKSADSGGLDPSSGRIEVSEDAQLVPVWEDKVVVWVVSAQQPPLNGACAQSQTQRSSSSNGKKYYHHGNGGSSSSGGGAAVGILLPPGHHQSPPPAAAHLRQTRLQVAPEPRATLL